MPSKIKGWKKLSSTKVFEHPRITLFEDEVELPSGATTKYLKYAKGADAVCVLCIDGDRLLIQQEYSYPPNEVLYQVPGGGVKPGESPQQAALRELREESGQTTQDISQVGSYYMNNRRSSARMHVFVAKNCQPTQKHGGDEEEHIVSEWVSFSKFKKLIAAGQIADAALLIAWTFYQNNQT